MEMGMTCMAQAPPPCWMELYQLLPQIPIPLGSSRTRAAHWGSFPTYSQGLGSGKVALNVSNGIGLNE